MQKLALPTTISNVKVVKLRALMLKTTKVTES